jgi:hypothetical protein
MYKILNNLIVPELKESFYDSFDYNISDSVDTGAEIGGAILGILGENAGVILYNLEKLSREKR